MKIFLVPFLSFLALASSKLPNSSSVISKSLKLTSAVFAFLHPTNGTKPFFLTHAIATFSTSTPLSSAIPFKVSLKCL